MKSRGGEVYLGSPIVEVFPLFWTDVLEFLFRNDMIKATPLGGKCYSVQPHAWSQAQCIKQHLDDMRMLEVL